MGVAQVPIPTGLTTADLAPLARTSELSPLATTAGLFATPQWVLLGSYTSSTGVQNAITISSISGSYRTLKVITRLSGESTGSSIPLQLRLNGTSTSIYTGSIVSTRDNTSNYIRQATYVQPGQTAVNLTLSSNVHTSNPARCELIISNYSSSEYKTVVGRTVYSNTYITDDFSFTVGTTSAVTSLELSTTTSGAYIYTNPNSVTGEGFFVYGAK